MSSQLGTISFVGLVLLAGFQTALLYQVLRDTLWWKRLLETAIDQRPMRTGLRLPPFTATPLDNVDGAAIDVDTAGRTILFVSPDDTDRLEYATVPAVLHALQHRTEGALSVLCRGSQEQCRELTASWTDHMRAGGHHLEVLVDTTGEAAAACRIEVTPHAIVFDQQGLVAKYGAPVSRVSTVVELTALEVGNGTGS